MLHLSIPPISRNWLKILKLGLIALVLVLIPSCSQNLVNRASKDFIKLEAPLAEVLPKITLPPLNRVDENGQPIVITVGSTYTGTVVPADSKGHSDIIRYTFLHQHAVEGNRYIFAVVSYNTGGSGVFYRITAVDKTTLKSTDQTFFGEGLKILQVVLTEPKTDTVSVTYIEPEGVEHPPNNTRQKHFIVSQGKLREVSR